MPSQGSSSSSISPYSATGWLGYSLLAALMCPTILCVVADQLKEIFNLYDEELDGKIDGTQIGDVVRAAGLKPTNAMVTKVPISDSFLSPITYAVLVLKPF